MSAPRAKGYIADSVEAIRKRSKFGPSKFGALWPFVGAPLDKLPLSTFNRAFLPKAKGGPGILNQRNTSACTGHATAGAATTRLAIIGAPVPLISPIGCYDVGRIIGGARDANGKLVDEGAAPSDVVQGVSQFGVVSAQTFGKFPADSATINDEPTLLDMELAADFKLIGAHFIESTGDARALDLMRALSAGFPTTGAVPASDPAFESYTGGILDATTGDLDHYIYVIDYEWDGSSLDSFVGIGVNSWGDGSIDDPAPEDGGWGESGLFRFNRRFLDRMADLAVFDVAAATTKGLQ